MSERKTPPPASPRNDPHGREVPPSPPERHPGKKPEEAGGEFEDLEKRDRGNVR